MPQTIVIDAFDETQTQRKDVKLVVAAKASHPRYAELGREYAKGKPCRDSVSFVINSNSIPDLLASTDIFVYATPNDSNDSLPRALLEAQSAGLPVVTTDTTGCPEIVRSGKTGFVVPYEAKAVAGKVLKLIHNPDLRQEMGKEAQQWIAKTFNWDRMADEYARVFREVLG